MFTEAGVSLANQQHQLEGEALNRALNQTPAIELNQADPRLQFTQSKQDRQFAKTINDIEQNPKKIQLSQEAYDAIKAIDNPSQAFLDLVEVVPDKTNLARPSANQEKFNRLAEKRLGKQPLTPEQKANHNEQIQKLYDQLLTKQQQTVAELHQLAAQLNQANSPEQKLQIITKLSQHLFQDNGNYQQFMDSLVKIPKNAKLDFSQYNANSKEWQQAISQLSPEEQQNLKERNAFKTIQEMVSCRDAKDFIKFLTKQSPDLLKFLQSKNGKFVNDIISAQSPEELFATFSKNNKEFRQFIKTKGFRNLKQLSQSPDAVSFYQKLYQFPDAAQAFNQAVNRLNQQSNPVEYVTASNPDSIGFLATQFNSLVEISMFPAMEEFHKEIQKALTLLGFKLGFYQNETDMTTQLKDIEEGYSENIDNFHSMINGEV